MAWRKAEGIQIEGQNPIENKHGPDGGYEGDGAFELVLDRVLHRRIRVRYWTLSATLHANGASTPQASNSAAQGRAAHPGCKGDIQ
jgi:hypothetical protein